MKKFYVIGNNVSKSLSPTIFNYWFKKYKIKAKYGYLELNNKNFDKNIKKILEKKETSGLNITIPFKKRIITHISQLEKHAKKINAVNCIIVGKKVRGINTDWAGYYKTLPKPKKLKDKKIILIGYGGAALAIHYLLVNKGFKNIKIFNRSKKLLKFVDKKKYTLSINSLNKHLADACLIINTTPLNPINSNNKKLISKNTLLSDIVYKPKETKFLSKFPENKKIYGISMLVEQAIPCFKHWVGFNPKVDSKLIKILDEKIK